MTILVVLTLNTLNSLYVFPVTEGWWETYAWLGGDTYDYYSNLELKFPPLYTIIIKHLYQITNANIIYIRLIIGVISLATTIMMYKWLQLFYNNISAALGVLIATLFVINNNVYLVKDYHTVVSFFVCIVLYTINKAVNSETKYRSSIMYFLCGISCALLFLTKQNLGIFVSLGALIFCIKSNEYSKQQNYKTVCSNIIYATLGTLLPIAYLYKIIPNMFGFMLNNDSKGSLMVLLFIFLIDKHLLLYIILAVMYIICFLIIKYISEKLKSGLLISIFINLI